MDSSEVGRVIIIVSTIWTFWGIRKPLYAIYLEYGARFFYSHFFTPFFIYSRFFRSLKNERNKWAEETIEKHKNNK